MNLITTKILVAILFGLLRFFFGLLPVKLYACLKFWEKEDEGATFINEKRHRQVNCYLALFQSFSGGVLFATCFLHMMPEVYESVEDLKKYGEMKIDFPYSQLIICAGFFLVYFIEELSHWLLSISRDDCLKKCKGKRGVSPIDNKISPQINGFVLENEKNSPKKDVNEKEAYINSEKEDFSVDLDVELENQKNLESGDDIETTKELEKMIDTQSKTNQQILRCILIIIALSFHAIFEGLAIGLQNSQSDIWYLFTAISIHSATILFCISLESLIAKAKLKIIIIHVIILSTTSPLGVFIGLIISITTDMDTAAKSVAVVLLEGISAGTILYITFFEVLKREKERRVFRFRRAIFILSGFILMAVLEYLEIYH